MVLAAAGLILIIAGLTLVAISTDHFSRYFTLVNAEVRVPENEPYGTPRAVSLPYYLSGNSNGRINGTLLAYDQCCIDFYIFTASAWYSWVANGENATNSTNSPVFSVTSSSIDSPSGVSVPFSFVPNPADTYELVFFNANRSLWNSNSTEAFSVVAAIYLDYDSAPAGYLAYPGAALVVAGAALIFVRYLKK